MNLQPAGWTLMAAACHPDLVKKQIEFQWLNVKRAHQEWLDEKKKLQEMEEVAARLEAEKAANLVTERISAEASVAQIDARNTRESQEELDSWSPPKAWLGGTFRSIKESHPHFKGRDGRRCLNIPKEIQDKVGLKASGALANRLEIPRDLNERQQIHYLDKAIGEVLDSLRAVGQRCAYVECAKHEKKNKYFTLWFGRFDAVATKWDGGNHERTWWRFTEVINE